MTTTTKKIHIHAFIFFLEIKVITNLT
jgi:hypothetical protein